MQANRDIDVDEYLQCLKKKIQHKVRNPFDLPMLNFQFQQLHGWKNATMQLETSAKIFSMRVDCFYEDVSKTVNSMARNNSNQVQSVKKKSDEQMTIKRLQEIRIDKFLQKPDNLRENSLNQKQQDAKIWHKIYSRCDNISQLIMLKTKLDQNFSLNWIEFDSKRNLRAQQDQKLQNIQMIQKSQRRQILESLKAIKRQDFICFKQITKIASEIKSDILKSIKKQANGSQRKARQQPFLDNVEQFTKYLQEAQDCDRVDGQYNEKQQIALEEHCQFDQNQFLSNAFLFPQQFLNPAEQSQDYAKHYRQAVGFELPEYVNPFQNQVNSNQTSNIYLSSDQQANNKLIDKIRDGIKPFLDSHPKKKPKKKKKAVNKKKQKQQQQNCKNINFNYQIEQKSIILNPQAWLRKDKGSKQHLFPIQLQNSFPLNSLFLKNNFLFDVGRKKRNINQQQNKKSLTQQLSQAYEKNVNTQYFSEQLSFAEQTLPIQTHEIKICQPQTLFTKNQHPKVFQSMIFSKKAQIGMKQIKRRVQQCLNIQNNLRLLTLNKVCQINPLIDPLDVFAAVLHLAHQKQFVLEKLQQGVDIFLVR